MRAGETPLRASNESAGPGRRESGFTLIEVMVAIVILTVGLLSLAQMMVLATNSNALSGRMTSASALAKDQLERLKATPFYVDPVARVRSPVLQDGGALDTSEPGYRAYYDSNGLSVNNPDSIQGDPFYEVRWEVTTVPTGLPLEMVEIGVRCLSAAEVDQFQIIGEALFRTYRTANVR